MPGPSKKRGLPDSTSTVPFPADSLFHGQRCDAYVAMYHDQGLIPVKTVDFRRTVNITLGLPFVRTSVGHGTGLDIAGTGTADPTSLIEAYRDAESIVARGAAGRRAGTKTRYPEMRKSEDTPGAARGKLPLLRCRIKAGTHSHVRGLNASRHEPVARSADRIFHALSAADPYDAVARHGDESAFQV